MRFEMYSDSGRSVFGISCMGYSSDVSVTRFGPGKRNQYIVHYVLSGKGYFNGNVVEGGQGFLIYPGQSEYYYPDKTEPWEFLWLVSKDERFNDLLSGYNADESTGIFNFDALTDAYELARAIKENNNTVKSPSWLLERFLNLYNSHCNGDYLRNNTKSSAEVYTDFCVGYIKDNIHNKITVENLSKLVGVSSTYLYRIFNQRFGKAPKVYITDVKLGTARKLLTQTELSMTEIANSIGFPDVLSFSKAFSKKFGMSPSAYRKAK